MAVTEYIGARYVPLFMGAWDNTQTYEPLSIVTYQGNSYTSRQAVPAGVSLDNATYWAETGNFNAQVEAYREQVERISDRLPFDAFNAYNTVEDSIDHVQEKLSNDASKIGVYLHVSAENGDDDEGDGSTESPYKTLSKAFSHCREHNKRDINIYMDSGGDYDLYDNQRLTNIQLHLITGEGVTDTVNLLISTLTVYNGYLHIAGRENNKLNVTISNELHQDVGALYFYDVNLQIRNMYCSWCGITFGRSSVEWLSYNGNYSFIYCDVTISACTWINDNATKGYFAMKGGHIEILTSLVLGGNTSRTIPFFSLQGTILECSVANITAADSYANTGAFIHMQYAFVMLSATANTKISAIFTGGAVDGYGWWSKQASLIEIGS